MEKKKGSTILMILAISAILVILAGVSLSAMAFTQNGNAIEKEQSDLLYAAESGIEQAVANVNKLDYDSTSVGGIETFNLNYKFSSENMTVAVSVKKITSDDEFQAISTSTIIGTTKNKVVKSKIKKMPQFIPGTESLLKYALCGSSVNIYTNSPLDPAYTLINSLNNAHIQYIGAGTPISYAGVTTDNKAFIAPNFNFPTHKDALGNDANIVINSLASLDALANSAGSQGVIKRMYTIVTHPYTGTVVPIYLVNTQNLIITADAGFDIKDRIIVCKGNMTVLPTSKISEIDSEGKPNLSLTAMTGGPTLQLDMASVIARNLNLYVANFTLGRAIYNSSSGMIANSVDLNAVDNIIGSYATNWSGVTGTTSGSTWMPTEVEYN